MSERKVLNKYYPPDFDPSKIPRLKVKRDGKFGIRLMAPFNMRCNTCGEYIYKGKKFNARKEDAEGEYYIGLRIFRFYIKCPRCIAEIAFKTDPENTDYTLEAGATRNFEAAKTAERLAKIEQEEKEAEEKNNPMKVLENRTKASLQEMDMIETLEELRELRQKHSAVSLEAMLSQNKQSAVELAQRQREREEEEDEQFVRSVFGKDGTRLTVKRIDDDDDDDDDDDADDDDDDNDEEVERTSTNDNGSNEDGDNSPANKKTKTASKPTDLLLTDVDRTKSTRSQPISLTHNPIKPTPQSSLKDNILQGIVRTKKSQAASTSSVPPNTNSLPPAGQTPLMNSGANNTTVTVDPVKGHDPVKGSDPVKGPDPVGQSMAKGGLANLTSYSSSSDSE